jgi:hypothetical protein
MLSRLTAFLVNKEQRSLLDVSLLFCELRLMSLPPTSASEDPMVTKKALQILQRFLQIPPKIIAGFTDYAFMIVHYSAAKICKWPCNYPLIWEICTHINKTLVTKNHPAHTCVQSLRTLCISRETGINSNLQFK